MTILRYKNTSRVTKTFYGVTFKPNETKDVSGYINDPKFIRVTDSVTPKKTESVTKSVTTKTEQKAEVK